MVTNPGTNPATCACDDGNFPSKRISRAGWIDSWINILKCFPSILQSLDEIVFRKRPHDIAEYCP